MNKRQRKKQLTKKLRHIHALVLAEGQLCLGIAARAAALTDQKRNGTEPADRTGNRGGQ